MHDDIILTQSSYKKLQQELDHLKTVKRSEMSEALRKARSYGDLSENFEYHAARRDQGILNGKIARLQPCWLAVVGVTAYRAAFGRRDAAVGPQDGAIGETRVWVLPNPSGLNAFWTTPKLVEAFRELRLHVEGQARSSGQMGVA